MTPLTRRELLTSSVAGIALSQVSPLLAPSTQRKGRIRQSVCQWCYSKTPIDQLAEYAAKIGLRGIDLLKPNEYEIPRRFGLICTMAYAGGGEIGNALNRTENHAAIEQAFRTNIPL